VICIFTPLHEDDPLAHPYLTRARRFIVYWAFLTPTTSLPPSPRQHILRLSRKPWLLGESLPVPYAVDTCSELRTARGYSVPPLRLTRCEGPHSSPGFFGGSLGRLQNRPAHSLAVLAQADNPCRLVQRNDDSDVDSSACPYTALLDGILRRILSDRLFSPLLGLMVSRYPRGDAVTSTPEGQELHLHGDEVIKDPMILTLYPLSSCGEGSFRETDRTCRRLLGARLGTDSHLASPCPRDTWEGCTIIQLRPRFRYQWDSRPVLFRNERTCGLPRKVDRSACQILARA